MTPAPLQVGQAPSELALNSAGFTPFAFANALRIGSSSPVYVAGLLRRDPLIAPWSTAITPSRLATEPWINELLPEPATPAGGGSLRRRPARPPYRRRGRGRRRGRRSRSLPACARRRGPCCPCRAA